MTATGHATAEQIPIIDVSPLLAADASSRHIADVATAIDDACRRVGFFGVVGHGVDPTLQQRLEAMAHEFFALPDDEKSAVSMTRGGRAWRGWFPLGGELTSGRPDRKEGLYIGLEHPADHPLIVAGAPLHGQNLFPSRPADLGPIVLEWLDEMRVIADAVLRGMAIGLGLPPDWFADNLTYDPTVLFRIFTYPPQAASAESESTDWGVAEHTDYGLLTILAQDDLGGLEVAAADGSWISVAPQDGMFVCNLGDMLERLTGGRYRSTPHRVRNTSGRPRLSFPYFFDPSWDAVVPRLPTALHDTGQRDRWDGADVLAWEGTYGDYLTGKVAKVFPQLAERDLSTKPY